MTQFKAYPKYKDSGVKWLGEVPEYWDVLKLKNIGKSIIGLTYNPSDICDNTKDAYLVLRSSNVKDGKLSFLSNVYVRCNVSKDLIIRNNDILICSRNGSRDLIGKNTLIKNPQKNITFGAFMTVYRSCFAEYIYWILNSYIFKAQAGSYLTTTVNQLTISNLNNMAVPFAFIKEQEKIVSYLDRETAKIDTLIAKQEKLIELLEEQRKSIISHAVTKGLDPNAPMKDSGIEWLGEVPEHWNYLKNRHVFKFSKGLTITKENLIDKGIPCVSYGEIHSKFGFEFDPKIDDMKYVSEDYLKTDLNSVLKYGDFIFADTSEDFEGSGNFSYLNGRDNVFAGYHTVIARLKTPQNPRFIAYFFNSNAHRKQIQTSVKGIKVFSITQGILKDIYVLLPPINEQNNIVDFLDQKINKIHKLKFKQQRLIEKLKEYRASVISHAVTGKIDVRELVA